MAEPFLAEIRIFGFNFPPRGWAQCDGQILPINQNQSLYSLLGTAYGGDGRTSFGLPDLRGRAAAHKGNIFTPLGRKAGEENVTLGVAEIPSHTHTLQAFTENADSNDPSGRRYATSTVQTYHDYDASKATPLNSNVVGNAGGGQGHNNMHPSLALNFCIAMQGLFPSRN